MNHEADGWLLQRIIYFLLSPYLGKILCTKSRTRASKGLRFRSGPVHWVILLVARTLYTIESVLRRLYQFSIAAWKLAIEESLSPKADREVFHAYEDKEHNLEETSGQTGGSIA